MNKIQLIIIVSLLLTGSLIAQKVTPTVISGGSGVFTASGVNLSYTIGEPANTTLTANGITLSQGFEKNNIKGGDILPVTLISFVAETANNRILLNWQTTNELNVADFIIQSSKDGQSFASIGNVQAIGNGNYTFTDKRTIEGTVYYRLLSVDKDGATSFSKVVSVTIGYNQSFLIVPNPARDFATISFSKTVDKATIAVFDLSGKAIITQSLNGSTNTYKLNTQSLTNGVYVIKVNTATGSYNEKLLINK